MNKLLTFISALVVFAGSVHAQVNTFNTASGDYATSGNWSLGSIPGNGNNHQPWIGNGSTQAATSSTATGYTTTSRFVVGINSGGNGTLTLNGSAGTLTYGGDFFNNANYIGVDGGTGVVNVDAGTLNINNNAWLRIGANGAGADGTLNIGGGTVTVNSGGSVVVGAGSGATGAISMTDGVFNVQGLVAGDSLTGSASLDVSGGTMNIVSGGYAFLGNYNNASSPTTTFSLSGTGVINSNGDFAVGRYHDGTGTQTGGTLNILGSARLWLGSNGNSDSTYTLSNGAINISSSSNQGLIMGFGDARSTFNLDGGTLTTPRVTTYTGTETFNFNGGTLQAARDEVNFMGGLTAANVESGGAIIDTDGNDITINQALLDGGGGGGLTKNGSGTLILSGTSTYTGDTSVNEGTLNLSGGYTGGGTITAADGVTFQVGSGATIIGDIDILDGGLFSPGSISGNPANSIATLSLDNLTLTESATGGSTYLYTLNPDSDTADDVTITTGGLDFGTLGDGLINTIGISSVSSAGDRGDLTDTWVLFTIAGDPSAFASISEADFKVKAVHGSYLVGTPDIYLSGNQIILTGISTIAVPEPSSLILISLGAILLRRRIRG